MFSRLNLPAWSRATASRTKLSARQEARGETGGRKPSHTVRCFPSSGFLHFRQDDQFSGRLLVRKYTVHTCLYVCVYRAYTHAGKALSTSAWYPRICTCSTCPPSDRFILPNNGEFHWFGEIATFKKTHDTLFPLLRKEEHQQHLSPRTTTWSQYISLFPTKAKINRWNPHTCTKDGCHACARACKQSCSLKTTIHTSMDKEARVCVCALQPQQTAVSKRGYTP